MSVGGGETVTLMYPQVGVTGRYIIVQVLGRLDTLALCEVEAGEKVEFTGFIITNFGSDFPFVLPICQGNKR